MNLSDVSLILSAKSRDYDAAHSRVLRLLGLDKEQTTLREYLTLIDNDVDEWFQVTPAEQTKPKTAVLYLLDKSTEVRDEIGEEECDALSARIRTAWKDQRTKGTTTVAVATPDDDEEVRVLKKQIQVLRDLVEELLGTNTDHEALVRVVKRLLPEVVPLL